MKGEEWLPTVEMESTEQLKKAELRHSFFIDITREKFSKNYAVKFPTPKLPLKSDSIMFRLFTISVEFSSKAIFYLLHVCFEPMRNLHLGVPGERTIFLF